MTKRKRITIAAIAKTLTAAGMIRSSEKAGIKSSGFCPTLKDDGETIDLRFLPAGNLSNTEYTNLQTEMREYAQLALDDAEIGYVIGSANTLVLRS